jgi:hypothetical protein
MPVEILVRLEGETEPVALDQLAWEHVAPCGCTCGVMNADHYGADRDAAFKRFLPNADARRQDETRGFLFRLAHRDAVIDRMKQRCAHEPRFGVEVVPVPAGHRWATAGSSSRSHLVPVPEATKEHSFREWTSPICGATRRDDLWSGVWNDEPHCTRCERRARALATPTTDTPGGDR